MKKITYTKKAFTLAETLITLMIIGVIAAMTIPGLKKTSEERTVPPKVLKAYNTVSTATKELRAEYGPIKLWPWGDKTKLMDEMYIPKFNVVKNCKTNGGCFKAGYRPKSLNGNDNNDFQNGSGWYTFVTADGMYWAIGGSGTCAYTEGTYIKKGCMHFEVDVNGPKDPNIVGVDVFGFEVTPDGVYPFGGCPGCDTTSCSSSGVGWGCTAKIIQEGKISW